ncbi:MAG TPA: phospholipase D-like domain-containing protein [Steroidobacteraceae bacterium]|nr:phospholipase D-like domain-containing protein [Steroidobacteraceae bacterium]
MLASESAPEPPASQAAAASRRPRRSWPRPLIVGVVLAIWLGTAFWETHKPLPPGTHTASDWYTTDPAAVRFIADVTAADGYGRPVASHAAFDAMLQTVRTARELVLIDAFRFTSDLPAGTSADVWRPIAAELRDALIARRHQQPGLRALVIVDPAAVEYGRRLSADLARLQDAGIDVVVANLDPLRDSNFLYSSLWRLTTRWWTSRVDAASGDAAGHGDALSRASAALAAANLKADRRNLLIADDGRGGLTGILSATELSAAGAADSNIAIQLAGPALVRLLRSEVAIAKLSGWTGVLGAPEVRGVSTVRDVATASVPPGNDPGATQTAVRVLTEGAVRDALIDRITAVRAGDAIDIAAFYLSDRAVIESLIAASRRGAVVRLILDPGEDGFGRSGAGIPNRSVAGELLAASDGDIRVRWYRTHGERFRAGLVLIRTGERCWLAVGSANLTRRSLDDYDLVANAAVSLPRDSMLAEQASGYFETLWSNRAGLGIEYTADAGVYTDASQLDYWRYRLMEATGLSLF